MACECAKHALSPATQTTMEIDFLYEGYWLNRVFLSGFGLGQGDFWVDEAEISLWVGEWKKGVLLDAQVDHGLLAHVNNTPRRRFNNMRK
jgi:hypothetical protein